MDSKTLLEKHLAELPEEVETVTLPKEEFDQMNDTTAGLLRLLNEARQLLRYAKGDVRRTAHGMVTTGSWSKARTNWAKKVDPIFRAIERAQEQVEKEG